MFIKKLLKLIICSPIILIVGIIEIYQKLISLIGFRFVNFWLDSSLYFVNQRKKKIKYKNTDNLNFTLYTPNSICKWRADTFSYKEPETLKWIEEYGGDGAFFDIGANVGLYSIYYAKQHLGNIYSFEPSVFNLSILVKNLNINKINNRVTIITNPLSSVTGVNTFNLQSSAEGGALSAFGVDYGQDGNPMSSSLSFNVIGFTIDDLLNQQLICEIPSLIKIDVDGIEHLIIEGMIETIQNPKCKTILVEVHQNFKLQAYKVNAILTNLNFTLTNPDCINQIWVKI